MTNIHKAAREALEALEALLARDERNTCQHESTHRGGAIWTICDDCGAKWADDRGGKPDWVDPPEWIAATNAITALRADRDRLAAEVEALRAVHERAARLVEGADFRLGGVLSAESKASEIPSIAYSQVKARHLASLRDAVRAAIDAAKAGAA